LKFNLREIQYDINEWKEKEKKLLLAAIVQNWLPYSCQIFQAIDFFFLGRFWDILQNFRPNGNSEIIYRLRIAAELTMAFVPIMVIEYFPSHFYLYICCANVSQGTQQASRLLAWGGGGG
jgi:hypothetical protein